MAGLLLQPQIVRCLLDRIGRQYFTEILRRDFKLKMFLSYGFYGAGVNGFCFWYLQPKCFLIRDQREIMGRELAEGLEIKPFTLLFKGELCEGAVRRNAGLGKFQLHIGPQVLQRKITLVNILRDLRNKFRRRFRGRAKIGVKKKHERKNA